MGSRHQSTHWSHLMGPLGPVGPLSHKSHHSSLYSAIRASTSRWSEGGLEAGRRA